MTPERHPRDEYAGRLHDLGQLKSESLPTLDQQPVSTNPHEGFHVAAGIVDQKGRPRRVRHAPALEQDPDEVVLAVRVLVSNHLGVLRRAQSDHVPVADEIPGPYGSQHTADKVRASNVCCIVHLSLESGYADREVEGPAELHRL